MNELLRGTLAVERSVVAAGGELDFASMKREFGK